MTTTLSPILPFLVLAACTPFIVSRGRRRELPTRGILAQLVLGAWIAAIVSLTLFPLPWRSGQGGPAVIPGRWDWPAPWASITPFATIRMSLEAGFGSAMGRVLIGNVVAFMPLGALAPAVDRRWDGWIRILALGLIVSTAIELAQLAWDLVVGMPWRSADVDDVIVNAFGTVLGFAVWRAAGAFLRRRALSPG